MSPFVITYVSVAAFAITAYIAKAYWLSAICLGALVVLSVRFALR